MRSATKRSAIGTINGFANTPPASATRAWKLRLHAGTAHHRRFRRAPAHAQAAGRRCRFDDPRPALAVGKNHRFPDHVTRGRSAEAYSHLSRRTREMLPRPGWRHSGVRVASAARHSRRPHPRTGCRLCRRDVSAGRRGIRGSGRLFVLGAAGSERDGFPQQLLPKPVRCWSASAIRISPCTRT